jgi:hypothetical protein
MKAITIFLGLLLVPCTGLGASPEPNHKEQPNASSATTNRFRPGRIGVPKRKPVHLSQETPANEIHPPFTHNCGMPSRCGASQTPPEKKILPPRNSGSISTNTGKMLAPKSMPTKADSSSKPENNAAKTINANVVTRPHRSLGDLGAAVNSATGNAIAGAISSAGKDARGYGPGPMNGYGPGPMNGYGPGLMNGYGPGPMNGYGTGLMNGYGPGPMNGYGTGPMNGYRPSWQYGYQNKPYKYPNYPAVGPNQYTNTPSSGNNASNAPQGGGLPGIISSSPLVGNQQSSGSGGGSGLKGLFGSLIGDAVNSGALDDFFDAAGDALVACF